jgi:RNA polymerase sigma factor (sigma-70 family)
MLHHHHTSIHSLGEERLRRAAGRRPAADAGELERTLIAAGDGSAVAWAGLVQRFRGHVVRTARSYGLDAAAADDVAQETWMRLYRHIGSIRDPQALGAWLGTTARRESLRELARGRREQPTDRELGADVPAQEAVEDELLSAERRDAVAKALETLPARHQALMRRLLAESERSYAEIAEELGMPIGSIGPIRGRCMARVRRELVTRGAIEAS